MKKRLGVVLILVFAFAGLADSVYLAQHELAGTPLICNIQDLSGCNAVAQSAYAHLFGIPIAEYGILFYAIVFVLAALELVIFDRFLRHALQAFALVGLLCSLVFECVQIFLIHALCAYCLCSAIATLLIFIAASFIEPIPRRPSRGLSSGPGVQPPRQPLSMPPTA